MTETVTEHKGLKKEGSACYNNSLKRKKKKWRGSESKSCHASKCASRGREGAAMGRAEAGGEVSMCVLFFFIEFAFISKCEMHTRARGFLWL